MLKSQFWYILPLVILFLVGLLQWYGFIQNTFIELIVAIYIVVFYYYLNPLIGFIAFSLVLLWFLYKYVFMNVNYNISELNKTSIRGEIPQRIIQMWVGPTQSLSKYKSYIHSVKTLNPNCEYMFFDKETIDEFFKNHYPEYISTYNSLPLLIQRLDFFRYVAIYHYGGIYLDLDIKALKSFDMAFFNHSCVFPVDEYLTEPMQRNPRFRPFFEKNCRFLLGQYGFGAEKKHPFLLYLVQTIHGNCHNIVKQFNSKKTMNKREKEWFVYSTTGPDFVTQCYIQYWNKSQIYILDNGRRQHVGKYAKHEYWGAWK